MPNFDPKLIEDRRIPGWKSRERLINISCSQFLALALPGLDQDKLAHTTALLATGVAYSELPTLHVDHRGRVIGHEGRHRARALLSAGVTHMPCVLRSCTIRWAHQVDPTNVDYIDEWPTSIISEDGRQEFPFPVAQERAGDKYEG